MAAVVAEMLCGFLEDASYEAKPTRPASTSARPWGQTKKVTMP